MSKLPIRAFVLVGMMLLAVIPLAQITKADPQIELQVDMNHMILTPGESMNLTLTIENNGSSIEDYDVETTTAGLSSLWTATPTSSSIANVLPTYNTSTTIVVQLAEICYSQRQWYVHIVVNESDGSASSSIDVYVSVAVVYNPHLDATGVGDQGLLSIQPGQSVDLSIPVSNHGSVMDSYLLSVGEEPDLAGWWASYSSSGSANTTNPPPSWSASVSDVLTLETHTLQQPVSPRCWRNFFGVQTARAIPRISQLEVGKYRIIGMMSTHQEAPKISHSPPCVGYGYCPRSIPSTRLLPDKRRLARQQKWKHQSRR